VKGERWKLKVESWKLKVESWTLEVGRWKVGRWTLESGKVGRWKVGRLEGGKSCVWVRQTFNVSESAARSESKRTGRFALRSKLGKRLRFP
jgi:hypothetical protein